VPASTGVAVRDEVLANLFRAVAEEMAWVLLRSAHTTFVKETQDFAAALVTPRGEVFAYPHTTGVTSLMGMPLAAGVEAGRPWSPGDILLTNDPYSTAGMVMHLNDLYLFRPIFAGERLLCFAWSFIHCTDVGGAAPGSIDMLNHEIHQEGFRVSPVKLYRSGELDRRLWRLLADNCRIPALNWGDLGAMVAALTTAEERVGRLVERYGAEEVTRAMGATLDRTERLTRHVLKTIPRGEYSFTEYFEDDYVSDLPVRLRLCLRARGDGTVELDFGGSDPQVRSALNLPTGGQRHHPFLSLSLVNLVVTRADGIHLNHGILRCIDLTLPPSSVVNASFPAACGMRYTTAMRIHDLILGALQQALPGAVPAGGASQLVVTYVSTSELGADGRVVVANPVQGGSGGGPDQDGVSGADYPSAFLRNVPVEVLESEVPALVHRFGLEPDSEGAGRWRGGFGVRYDIQVRHSSAVVVMRGRTGMRTRRGAPPAAGPARAAGTGRGRRAARSGAWASAPSIARTPTRRSASSGAAVAVTARRWSGTPAGCSTTIWTGSSPSIAPGTSTAS
jgi:N-methylhydantoinase B